MNTENIRYKANGFQPNIKYQRLIVWNSIPVEIQKLPKPTFKTKFKAH